MKKILITLVICLLGFTSCIQKDLPECETAGLSVSIYVERFGDEQAFTRAETLAAISEASFNHRIENLDYYLYKDDVLVDSGPLSEAVRAEGPYYTFTRTDIPWGEYKLALMANCVETILKGSPEKPDELNI